MTVLIKDMRRVEKKLQFALDVRDQANLDVNALLRDVKYAARKVDANFEMVDREIEHAEQVR